MTDALASEYTVALFSEHGWWKWLCSCGAKSKTKRSVDKPWCEVNNKIGASVHLSMHFARKPPGRPRLSP